MIIEIIDTNKIADKQENSPAKYGDCWQLLSLKRAYAGRNVIQLAQDHAHKNTWLADAIKLKCPPYSFDATLLKAELGQLMQQMYDIFVHTQIDDTKTLCSLASMANWTVIVVTHINTQSVAHVVELLSELLKHRKHDSILLVLMTSEDQALMPQQSMEQSVEQQQVMLSISQSLNIKTLVLPDASQIEQAVEKLYRAIFRPA